MDLIRDVLDAQFVDRKQRKIGRVDGIVIEVRDGGPPILKRIEVGALTKARRLHPRLAAWVSRWSRPYSIPWTAIRDIGVDVEADVDATETPLLDGEKWARRIVARIPRGERGS